MVDEQLRRLIRARDLSTDDVGPARRVAAMASRVTTREFAAGAWQEVLRRAGHDDEAEERVLDLGCDLICRGEDDRGAIWFESRDDGTEFLLAPELPFVFVSASLVTYGDFRRFLEATDRAAQAAWLRTARTVDEALRFEENPPEDPVAVSWQGARAFAAWAEGRLLTTREWMKLADRSSSVDWEDGVHEEWTVDFEKVEDDEDAEEMPCAQAMIYVRGSYWTSATYTGEPIGFRHARRSWFAREAVYPRNFEFSTRSVAVSPSSA